MTTQLYIDEFPNCQFIEAAGRFVDFGRHIHNQNCVHHIWGRRGQHEHWSNYLTVSPAAHDWAHRNLTVSRISAMWFKWDLARRLLETDETELRHFDQDALRAASGFWVPGWVENKLNAVDLPDWCYRMGSALLEGCDG